LTAGVQVVGKVRCAIAVFRILAVSMAPVRSQTNVSVKVGGAALCAI